LSGLWALTWVGGCGGTPSTQDHLQAILEDQSLSETDKLEKLAVHCFDLRAFAVTPATPTGHAVELQIRGHDDRVIRQVMDGKGPDALHQALKEFHFKTLNLQLADYLRRAKDMHLGQLTVSLQLQTPGSVDDVDGGQEMYRLVLPAEQFAAFLEVAKLRPAESLAKAEKLWRVISDEFR
jgi:hypothetical protein